MIKHTMRRITPIFIGAACLLFIIGIASRLSPLMATVVTRHMDAAQIAIIDPGSANVITPAYTDPAPIIPVESVPEPVPAPDASTAKPPTAKPAPKPVTKKVCAVRPEGVNYPYTFLSPVSMSYSLSDYIPPDLVPIPSDISAVPDAACIRAKILPDFRAMLSAMRAEKIVLLVGSSYRSPNFQESLQHKNNPEIIDGASYDSVAKPHHSEHQLGTTMDFAAPPGYNVKTFDATPAYAWLKKHAHEYGFVQSYEYSKESITGYRGEPWHWRYVGVEHATAVHNDTITLMEYLQELNKKDLEDNQPSRIEP